MDTLVIRKVVSQVEETRSVAGRNDDEGPLRKVAVCAVVSNPLAGRGYVEDISSIVEASAEIGTSQRLWPHSRTPHKSCIQRSHSPCYHPTPRRFRVEDTTAKAMHVVLDHLDGHRGGAVNWYLDAGGEPEILGSLRRAVSSRCESSKAPRLADACRPGADDHRPREACW